jgi:hypothetical protein
LWSYCCCCCCNVERKRRCKCRHIKETRLSESMQSRGGEAIPELDSTCAELRAPSFGFSFNKPKRLIRK